MISSSKHKVKPINFLSPGILGCHLLFTGLLLSLSLPTHATIRPDQVSFAVSWTNVPPSATQVPIVFRRFADSLQNPTNAEVSISSTGLGGLPASLTVAFPAGAASVTYHLPVPSIGVSNKAASLSITHSASIQPFGITQHVLRFPSTPPAPAATTINAVIFSGADSPLNAVVCGGTLSSTRVVGGIVALGGAPSPLVPGNPAQFQPDLRYSQSVWIPPLTPSGILLRLNTPASFLAY